MKFRAPQDDIAAHLRNLATAKKLHRATRSGRASFAYNRCEILWMLMNPGSETILARVALLTAGSATWLRGQLSCLRRSMWCQLFFESRSYGSAKARRPLPMEMLEIQGWNIWSFPSSGPGDHEVAPGPDAVPEDDFHAKHDVSRYLTRRLPTASLDEFSALSESQILSVAGNGMHLRAGVLLFCPGCSQTLLTLQPRV